MPFRENELASRNAGRIEVRPDAIRASWDLSGLLTADGYELRCRFTAGVKALSSKAELQMLSEVLLKDGQQLAVEDIVRYFEGPFRQAAAQLTGQRNVAAWLEGHELRQQLCDVLKQAAQQPAFDAGLEVLPPFQLDLQSQSFERQRAKAAQQAIIEKEAAAQVDRFARSAELLKQFQDIRASAPELSPGHVLERLGAGDQGILMQALMHASARRDAAKWLWAVAGPCLARASIDREIDGKNPPKLELYPLPPDLGPLRSVQADHDADGNPVLLVGAQRGFFVVVPDNLSKARAYRDDGAASALGFNRVVYWRDKGLYCATHSERGLLIWQAQNPASPLRQITPIELGAVPSPVPAPTGMSVEMSMRGAGSLAGPRNVSVINGSRLVLSVGGKLVWFDGNAIEKQLATASAEVMLIAAEDHDALVCVNEDGVVNRIDQSSGEVLQSARRSGRVRSAATISWMGRTRLLLATDDGPVFCLGSDDQIVNHYCSAFKGLRALAASGAMVAGISPDRQRLVLWNSWDGRQPAAELFIGSLARHRAADLTVT